MEDKKLTTFENKAGILSDLWMNYRQDKQFEDFVSYNDIGLPLSFLIDEDLVTPRPLGKSMVEETFDLLLGALEIEDEGFDSLDDLLVG
jgi:hypothetical protein